MVICHCISLIKFKLQFLSKPKIANFARQMRFSTNNYLHTTYYNSIRIAIEDSMAYIDLVFFPQCAYVNTTLSILQTFNSLLQHEKHFISPLLWFQIFISHFFLVHIYKNANTYVAITKVYYL